MRSSSVAVLAVVVASLWCGQAAAQASAKDEAKRHFDAGVTLAESEDFKAAAAEFETSVKLFSTKMGLYNLANAYKAIHRYGDALAAIERLEREFGKTLDADMQKEVAAFKKTVQAIVGKLDVQIDKEGAVIRVDGGEIGKSPLPKPLIVGPGDHVVEASLDGFKTARSTVKVESGSTAVAKIVLVPAKDETPTAAAAENATPEESAPEKAEAEAVKDETKPKRIWTWVAFGVGGAAAIGAAITGGVATSKTNDVKDKCDGNNCPLSQKDDADSAKVVANTTTALIVVAGVGIAAGVALYFMEPKWTKNEDAVEVTAAAVPTPGGGSFALAGRF